MTSDILLIGLFSVLLLVSWIWSLVVGFRNNTALGVLTIFFHPIPIIILAFQNWRDARGAFLLSAVSVAGFVFFSFSLIWNAIGMGGLVDIAERQASGEITEIEAAREAAQAMTEQLERMHRDGLISDEDYARQRAELEREMGVPDETAVDPGSQPGAAPASEVTVAEPDAPLEEPAQSEVAMATPPEDAGVEAPPEAEPEPESEAEPVVIKPPVLPEHRRRAHRPREPVIRSVEFQRAGSYIGKRVWVLDRKGVEREGILARVAGDHLVIERRLGKGAMSFILYDDQIKRIRVEIRPGEG